MGEDCNEKRSCLYSVNSPPSKIRKRSFLSELQDLTKVVSIQDKQNSHIKMNFKESNEKREKRKTNTSIIKARIKSSISTGILHFYEILSIP